ncbi:SDR family NAD(P)-dependent oxidoreductase [Sphingomonas koreensis]|jgi:NAD(P)-dependent dehydrogenase (short-subunit alcohol dehydrogenase family)|uniref:SDR family NAD(P)-dependent oxidoreductase n=1 Tax=Sphingomonas koreensis TaxID=93064 RepID=A0A430G7U7_9SPHN|nr:MULTISPECIES: SDR family oxidoreductase [Sphingomonas]MDK2768915.1 SDR family oxidoreductase [Sphingomonas sp.]PKP91729.1 MAG: 3-oxoacyl-ACP reductase [Alphaproteobacteria bacterium HGW-Alphaproteobacteria-16]PZU59914.1 MAG: 3-oxoacyl-ACP reductase [Sphingobium sp.]RSY89506.1 SDR family NAD(P)-dependent oxidoreductase [Sphingomonas koreensis]
MDLSIGSLFTVAGKTAIVTGGSSGVGRMIASALAANGARTCIVGRKRAALEAVASEIGCDFIVADLSLPDAIARLAGEIAAREAAIDILVNNAGTTWGAPFPAFPLEGFDKVFALNVRTPFLLTQALLPLLEAGASTKDFSRVINISSVGARMVGEDGGSVAYGPSKAAVEQMTRVMARQLGRHRITVNAIAPGWFPSRMNAPLGDQAAEDWISRTPAGRLGTARDMGGLALFLCSPAGAYVSGQIIAIDGGRSL